jgi:hypothetical protein
MRTSRRLTDAEREERSDRGVRAAVGGESCDLRLLGGELPAGLDDALARGLAPVARSSRAARSANASTPIESIIAKKEGIEGRSRMGKVGAHRRDSGVPVSPAIQVPRELGERARSRCDALWIG